MLSYTLHLQRKQTQRKDGLYRLCMSRDGKANMAFAFSAKMGKVVQM